MNPFDDIPASERRYLSLEAAAKYTGLSKRTLESVVAKGAVRSFMPCGKRLLLRESLEAWVEGRPDTTTTDLEGNRSAAGVTESGMSSGATRVRADR